MWDAITSLWAAVASGGGALAENLWVAICLSFWGSAVWIVVFALGWGDSLLRPPIDDPGMAPIYGVMLWLSIVLAMLVMLAQLIRTIMRADGRALGTALLGSFQYIMTCTIWTAYCATVVVSVNALTRGVRELLFTTTDPTEWELVPDDLTEASVSGVAATVLLFLSLLLWIAALAYIVVLLGRSVGLLVLVATAPIAGAGLIHDSLHMWFWKAFRWFHALAAAPLLMTLVIGLGIKTTELAATGAFDGGQPALAAAVPGVLTILVASVSPVALFRFLAFVDPGTTSGAAFRAGLFKDREGSQSAPSGGQTNTGGTPGAQTAQQTESATAQRAVSASTSSLQAGSAGAGASGGAAGARGGAAAASGSRAAAAGPAGVIGAGVVMGAVALVKGFQKAGAVATGVVSDVGSTTGGGDQSYPYDPAADVRRPWQRSRSSRTRPPVPIQEGTENDNV